jgi:hypothetical protein
MNIYGGLVTDEMEKAGSRVVEQALRQLEFCDCAAASP